MQDSSHLDKQQKRSLLQECLGYMEAAEGLDDVTETAANLVPLSAEVYRGKGMGIGLIRPSQVLEV